jgi:ADP-ribose pyrophosphatase YjhB (NUDIX family)
MEFEIATSGDYTFMEIKQVFEHYDRGKSRADGGYKFCPLCRETLVFKEVGSRQRPLCRRCGFVHFQNPSPAISILIIDDDSVVLGKRAENPGKGGWAIPSGYIEFDQDFLSAGVMEAKEETGLKVEIVSIVNVVSSFYSPGYHFLSLYLKASVIGGQLRAGDDLQEAGWFNIAGGMPELVFAEDQAMIEMLRTGAYRELPVQRNAV